MQASPPDSRHTLTSRIFSGSEFIRQWTRTDVMKVLWKSVHQTVDPRSMCWRSYACQNFLCPIFCVSQSISRIIIMFGILNYLKLPCIHEKGKLSLGPWLNVQISWETGYNFVFSVILMLDLTGCVICWVVVNLLGCWMDACGMRTKRRVSWFCTIFGEYCNLFLEHLEHRMYWFHIT